MPRIALPIRARRGALGAIVRPTLDEIERSRIKDAYVALPCPICAERHVLHSAESAVAAGLVPSDAVESVENEVLEPSPVEEDGILLPRVEEDPTETMENLRMWLATTELWDHHEGDRSTLLATLTIAARALDVLRTRDDREPLDEEDETEEG